MFSILHKTENGFNKIVLKDESSQSFAEIIPACGAILHSLNIIKEGRTFNVIDSYENADDFNKNVTRGFKGCKLSPFVCRMNKGEYHFAKNNYHIQKFYLGNHALHGELYNEAFIVINENVEEDKVSVSMKYEYRKNDPGYPFNYDCIITYELEKDSKLNVITEVINKDSEAIPIQDGWHPYFTLGDTIDELQLQFQSKEKIGFDSELIPTGKLTRYQKLNSFKKIDASIFDNCFSLNFAKAPQMCVLINTAEKIEVEIYPGEEYPYLQVYTPPHRKSIALENLSSIPDAFNNGIGLKILFPQETALFKTSYKITLLP
jgi:aldose 1-epimerase